LYDDEAIDLDNPYDRPCRKCGAALTVETWPPHRRSRQDYICGSCHRRMAAAYATAGPRAPKPGPPPPVVYTHLPFGWGRGSLLKNVPDDYLSWLRPQKMNRALRATIETEIARRQEMPAAALLPPPAHHPDLAVAGANEDALVMGRYGMHYHRPGCVTLKKAENPRPYAPFVNGIDPEGNAVLIETEPCTRCRAPRFGLEALLDGGVGKW